MMTCEGGWYLQRVWRETLPDHGIHTAWMTLVLQHPDH
jgi:hypothetical protein